MGCDVNILNAEKLLYIAILAMKLQITFNPPYMGLKRMNPGLADFIMTQYPESKHDLAMVFIQRILQSMRPSMFTAMITQHSWMFQTSYETLRGHILDDETLQSVLHLGAAAFEEISGEVVQTSAFVLRHHKQANAVINES